MKKTIKLFGIIALTAVFAFSMAACDNDASPDDNVAPGGTFTLTNIPSTYNGKYVFLDGGNEDELLYLLGAQSINIMTEDIIGALISDGRVNIPMYYVSMMGNVTGYSGNHTATVMVYIFNTANLEDPLALVIFESVTFSNGNANRSFNSGSLITP